MTAVGSETDNHMNLNTESRSLNNNGTETNGVTQSLTSTSPGSTQPTATIDEDKQTGQRQWPAKRVKGLAIVGTGLTDK
jgi:hypothetical protein